MFINVKLKNGEFFKKCLECINNLITIPKPAEQTTTHSLRPSTAPEDHSSSMGTYCAIACVSQLKNYNCVSPSNLIHVRPNF